MRNDLIFTDLIGTLLCKLLHFPCTCIVYDVCWHHRIIGYPSCAGLNTRMVLLCLLAFFSYIVIWLMILCIMYSHLIARAKQDLDSHVVVTEDWEEFCSRLDHKCVR